MSEGTVAESVETLGKGTWGPMLAALMVSNTYEVNPLSGVSLLLAVSTGSVALWLGRKVVQHTLGGKQPALMEAMDGLPWEQQDRISDFVATHRDELAAAVKGRTGMWMVREAGHDVFRPMTAETYQAFRDRLGSQGGTLREVVITNRKVVMSNYVAGVLHGPTATEPARVTFTPDGGRTVELRNQGNPVQAGPFWTFGPAPVEEASTSRYAR